MAVSQSASTSTVALANQGAGESIRRVGLPAEQPLGAETAMIDPVLGAASYADDTAVLDRDVQPQPLLQSTQAEGVQASTTSGVNPSTRCRSTRTGQAWPGA